jgi:hypothetical protein
MTIITARLAATCATVIALGLVGSAASAAAAVPTSSLDATATSNISAPAVVGIIKVSANTASENEIVAALKSAGVPNPNRWAKEVIEYRPYPTNDPNLTKLRNNIAKYNPGQETTDKIVSALTP